MSQTKKNKITIRPYTKEDKGSIISMLNSPSIKPDIWEWQFDNRHYASNIKPIVAIDHWGNIIGYNGMMPVKLHTQSFGLKEASWSCDFFVSQEARGIGVGKKIKAALKQQSNLTFALGTSPTAAKVLQQSGWHSYNRVYSYTRKPKASTNTVIAAELTQLPDKVEVNNLWHNVKNTYNAIIERDYAYLNWRYQQFPIGHYQYLAYYDNKQLISLCVYRQSENNLTLVDYLGPKNSTTDKQVFINTLAEKNLPINCTSSCTVWEQLLVNNTFKKSKNPANCFINAPSVELGNAIQDDFFIMAGDCDGDILAAAIQNGVHHDKLNTEKLRSSPISEQQFFAMEQQWDDLLQTADCDNLFLSWQWMVTWWRTFAKTYEFNLHMIGTWKGNELIGIAPLYQRSYKLYGVNIKQLQIIGSSWSGPNTFRSEYLDFIVNKKSKRSATYSLLAYIYQQPQWDALILADIREDSLTTRLIQEHYSWKQLLPRTVHQDSSIKISLTSDINEYKSQLSANFRRSVFTKRQQLEKKENITCRLFRSINNKNINIIKTLNTLQLSRWGKPCFTGKGEELHQRLIDLNSKNNNLFINTITHNNQTLTIAYCIIYKGTIYNIQLGFEEKILQKYSLGLIQLGESITNGFEENDLKEFDFLAGNGKKEFYKERFGGKRTHLQTKQYLRSPFLKLIYRFYDKKKSLYRKLKKMT